MYGYGHIHSLNGEIRLIEILKKLDKNNYMVKYNNQYCTAIYNGYTDSYYVDDIYGIINNYK